MVVITLYPQWGRCIYNGAGLDIGPTVIMGQDLDMLSSFQINQRHTMRQDNELEQEEEVGKIALIYRLMQRPNLTNCM